MTKALDSRLYEKDSYIAGGRRLLRVVLVRWMGVIPKRYRIVTAEDAKTGELIDLTDDQLGDYEFVCRAEPLDTDQTTVPAAA